MLLLSSIAVAFDAPSRAEIEAAALGAELAASGRAAARRGAWEECAADLTAAWSMDPNPRFAYEAAGCDARAGLQTEALDALEDAATSGFRDAVLLEVDADFIDLQTRPRWRRILAAIRAAAAAREAGSNRALGALLDEAYVVEPNNRLARRLAAPVGVPSVVCGRDQTGAGFHLYVLEGADELDASERAWWGLPTTDEITVGLAAAPWSWMAPP